jgi:hypothetical protein
LILACNIPAIATSNTTRTPLPTLTPTPLFYRWEAAQIVRAIRATGLECEDIHLMEPKEYGPIPALATQGVRFSIPSVCPDCSGMVLSFNDPAALEATKRFYTEAKPENNPEISSWVFEKDNILLQFSGELSKAQALRYGAVLFRLE